MIKPPFKWYIWRAKDFPADHEPNGGGVTTPFLREPKPSQRRVRELSGKQGNYLSPSRWTATTRRAVLHERPPWGERRDDPFQETTGERRTPLGGDPQVPFNNAPICARRVGSCTDWTTRSLGPTWPSSSLRDTTSFVGTLAGYPTARLSVRVSGTTSSDKDST